MPMLSSAETKARGDHGIHAYVFLCLLLPNSSKGLFLALPVSNHKKEMRTMEADDRPVRKTFIQMEAIPCLHFMLMLEG